MGNDGADFYLKNHVSLQYFATGINLLSEKHIKWGLLHLENIIIKEWIADRAILVMRLNRYLVPVETQVPSGIYERLYHLLSLIEFEIRNKIGFTL